MPQYPVLALVASYFPELEKWLERAGNPTKYMEEAETELAKIPQSAVEKACKTLMREEVPRVSRLPFEVARVARKIASRIEATKWQSIADGQETQRCRLCRDTGYVDILHPDTVAETLRTGKPPPFPYDAVALCTCPKGVAIKEANLRADRQHRRNIATYDPKRHVLRVVGILPMDQYQQLLGYAAEAARCRGDPKTIVRELAERTRVNMEENA